MADKLKHVELRFDPAKEDFELQAIKYLLDNSEFGQGYEYINQYEVLDQQKGIFVAFFEKKLNIR